MATLCLLSPYLTGQARQTIMMMVSRLRREKATFNAALMGSQKKNIVVCFPSVPLTFGGAEVHKNALIRQLRLRGHNVDEVNLPYKHYPHKQILKDCLAWRLLDLTEADGKKIDLVIASKFPAYVVKHPRKVIWLSHPVRQIYDLAGTQYDIFTDEDQYYKDAIKKIDEQVFSEAALIFSQSKNIKSRLERYHKVDSEVLYPPVEDAEKFLAKGYGDYVLYTGRLDPLKRVDLLIKMSKWLDPGIKIKLTGKCDHEYANSLRKLAYENGLQNRVEFLGFVDFEELKELYGSALAIYYAPYDEDYGYTTIEAFCAKKPVITATDSGGPTEFVFQDETGVVFDPNKLEEAALAVNELFLDKDLAKRMGEVGYESIQFMNWDYVIDNLLR